MDNTLARLPGTDRVATRGCTGLTDCRRPLVRSTFDISKFEISCSDLPPSPPPLMAFYCVDDGPRQWLPGLSGDWSQSATRAGVPPRFTARREKKQMANGAVRIGESGAVDGGRFTLIT